MCRVLVCLSGWVSVNCYPAVAGPGEGPGGGGPLLFLDPPLPSSSRWTKVTKKGFTILFNLGRKLEIGVQRVKMF